MGKDGELTVLMRSIGVSNGMMLIYSQTTSNIQVVQLKNLCSNFINIIHHKNCSMSEYINLKNEERFRYIC